MSVTIEQIATTQRILDQQKRDFADSLRPMLARMGYGLILVNRDARPQTSHIRTRARRRLFKCPKCDRRFLHKMHLGRHLTAIHQP